MSMETADNESVELILTDQRRQFTSWSAIPRITCRDGNPWSRKCLAGDPIRPGRTAHSGTTACTPMARGRPLTGIGNSSCPFESLPEEQVHRHLTPTPTTTGAFSGGTVYTSPIATWSMT